MRTTRARGRSTTCVKTATDSEALYLDSSALVKLVIAEPQSGALISQVEGRDLVSSELSLAEVPRAIRRLLSGARRPKRNALIDGLDQAFRDVSLVPVSRELLAEAGELPDAYLRVMDAIHVVSARRIAPQLEAMITYDQRQQSAAEKAGLVVLVPGSSGID